MSDQNIQAEAELEASDEKPQKMENENSKEKQGLEIELQTVDTGVTNVKDIFQMQVLGMYVIGGICVAIYYATVFGIWSLVTIGSMFCIYRNNRKKKTKKQKTIQLMGYKIQQKKRTPNTKKQQNRRGRQ